MADSIIVLTTASTSKTLLTVVFSVLIYVAMVVQQNGEGSLCCYLTDLISLVIISSVLLCPA